MHVNLDVNFVDKIVNEVKSQGVFDQFRKDSMADVDTKPAYQNLRQRVENSVSKYLSEQKWTPETNKNQLREKLRSNLMNGGFLDVGVQRIVDQVVNPKISTVFQPKIEDIVYKYLGIEKPEPKIEEKILPIGLNLTIKTDDMGLLPHDLEAVSPDSDKSTVKSEPRSDSKMDITDDLEDDDESPPFEPLEGANLIKIKDDENSNNSIMSGLSGLASQESNKIKDENNTTAIINNSMEISQESQLSQVSSNSHLSIVTNEEGTDKDVKPIVKEETNVHISEEAQMPKFNENSNSCPTVSAEKLHFDIKKDEIKFEGTDRNTEQNISAEQNNLIDSPEKIKIESNVQLGQSNDEISNTTLNTENSSYFDDDSEKGLQIVEEPTESSQISQPNSIKNLPESNIPLYDNLTESNDTLKTNSPLIEKQNDVSPNSKTSENSENQTPDENIKNNLQKSDNIKSDDSSDLPLPPPINNGSDNKLPSSNSHSKERENSSSSSSRHFSNKKHSKDKKSDKDKDKNRKNSSTNDIKKQDSGNKHSSSRHSSQSSSRSLSSSKENKSSSSSSSSHKSKHYAKDDKSSRYDKGGKKDKSSSSRDEKSPKTTNKEKSKEIDDHSLAKIKNYRRKSTDSNDGDTNKEGGNKIIKNGSDKNDKSSFTNSNNISNSTNNTNDSGASMDSETKGNANNLSMQRSENLSKPIIVDNLNNMELIISSNIITDTPISNKSEKEDIKSNNVVEVKELISTTEFLNEINKNDTNTIDSKDSPKKVGKTDIESDENDLEYFEITPEEEQNYTDLMNRYEYLLSKMFNANEILNKFYKNNNITINSPKTGEIKSSKMDNRKGKLFKKMSSVLPMETNSLNGKRKRKNSPITHTITTAESINNTLTIGCFEYDYNGAKRIKPNDMNVLLTTKNSPTPSEMSTGSKENDFSDKNANKTNEAKTLRLDENDRKNCGTPPVKATQRYSSDDLYKPRPVLSQRSRRRGLEGDIV